MKKYDFKKIEKKWRKKWQEDGLYKTEESLGKPKCYVLDMFPYPSGDGLHMGHTESYTATDIHYRYKKMRGFNVLHPQGFDSFGLPAENYAIKTNIPPEKTTAKNIANYEKQMKTLGFGYDWETKIVTSSPEYYKWTQWIFARFFENGLAYKKTSTINWCESCKTGLANEQVVDGKCERCKNQVIQKEIPGWFFKITDFADDLINDLDKVDWPDHTKVNQKNWIGRSEGAEVDFVIENSDKKITVFTTRVDTLFSGTFLILAPEHPLVKEITTKEQKKEVEKYLEETLKKTELERIEGQKEKTGAFTGAYAINPSTEEKIQIWISDFVLAGYGTGAVFADAHDDRDFEIAKKFNIPLKVSIRPKDDKLWEKVKKLEECFGGEGVLVNSKDFDGLTSAEARPKITEWLEKKKTGRKTINYRLRDWSISRQRYWGAPIPIVYNNKEKEDIDKKAHVINFYCQVTWSRLMSGEKKIETRALNPEEPERYFGNIKTGDYIKAVNKETKDVAYFEVKKVFGFKNLKELLSQHDILKQIYAPAKPAKILSELEKDYSYTNDYVEKINKNGLVGWKLEKITPGVKFVPDEHLPWLLPKDVDFKPTGESPLKQSKELLKRTEKIFGKGWTPEVDTMDTFVCSSWYYLRYPDAKNDKEFCSKEKLKKWLPVDVYIGGAEHTYMHLLYARFFTKALKKIGLIDFDEPFSKLRHQGMVLDKNGVRMSKSKGNVVNPDNVINRHGVDAVRMYMMFLGPLEDDVMWDEKNIIGIKRFLEKIWRLSEKTQDSARKVDKNNGISYNLITHKTIKKVAEDLDEFKFNTAISQMMILANELEKDDLITQADFTVLLRLLAPFAPHITEELWQKLGNDSSIHLEAWPKYEASEIEEQSFELVVQINGKVRDKFEVSTGIDEKEAVVLTLKRENVTKYTQDKVVKKTIFIPNRLINLVIPE